MNSWEGKRVTVMGLGLNSGGLGVVEYLVQKKAHILITDMKSEDVLAPTIAKINTWKYPHIQYVLGEHRSEDLLNADVVVKNPSVPPRSPWILEAVSAGVRVTTDIEMFFEELLQISPKPFVIGVTGTRGKSTTSSLVAYILQSIYGEDRVILAGNIRQSVLRFLPVIHSQTIIVLELSSFQLDSLSYSPDIGVITNIYPDHLNWHGSMEAYIQAKAHIFDYQSADQVFITNYDNDITRRLAHQSRARVVQFSRHVVLPKGAYVVNNTLYIDREPVMNLEEASLRGDHNQANILAAFLVAHQTGISSSQIARAIRTFPGLPGRQERLGITENGVEIINDTTSTMPEALYTALAVFQDKPLYLICGGENKKLSYAAFPSHMTSVVQGIILLPGESSDLMKQALDQSQISIPLYQVSNLEVAVRKALSLAKPGERIVFSPGATSFGQFQNEFERGDIFVQIVHQLTQLD